MLKRMGEQQCPTPPKTVFVIFAETCQRPEFCVGHFTFDAVESLICNILHQSAMVVVK